MKADVSYNDLIGTAAADISDLMSRFGGDDLSSIANFYKLDKNRFELIGLSIYGTDSFGVSLICIDKIQSTSEKEHLISLSLGTRESKKILDTLFKRLHIVLHDNSDLNEKYRNPELRYNQEAHFSDYHNVSDTTDKEKEKEKENEDDD